MGIFVAVDGDSLTPLTPQVIKVPQVGLFPTSKWQIAQITSQKTKNTLFTPKRAQNPEKCHILFCPTKLPKFPHLKLGENTPKNVAISLTISSF